MAIRILILRAGVLFEGGFSLWVSVSLSLDSLSFDRSELCSETHRVSHGSAVGSKKKMVAGKSCYRYEDVSCNNRNMEEHVFIVFFTCWNKKLEFWQMKIEVIINLLQ